MSIESNHLWAKFYLIMSQTISNSKVILEILPRRCPTRRQQRWFADIPWLVSESHHRAMALQVWHRYKYQWHNDGSGRNDGEPLAASLSAATKAMMLHGHLDYSQFSPSLYVRSIFDEIMNTKFQGEQIWLHGCTVLDQRCLWILVGSRIAAHGWRNQSLIQWVLWLAH